VHTFKHDVHKKVRGPTLQTLERLAESELASDIERLSRPVVSKEAFRGSTREASKIKEKLTAHSNQCDISTTFTPSATSFSLATSKSA
jgi:hypothetical protein